ncbi:unnamed protein product [Mytilus coruscus]|uniref:Integrase catalytic domain-containing protein n=1 Tax=Mytilus coruscus TaxID=42192 RepID=A0A6J8DMC2_MYTCO|nr:unnamed protein product [Mytilus coruscus]
MESVDTTKEELLKLQEDDPPDIGPLLKIKLEEKDVTTCPPSSKTRFRKISGHHAPGYQTLLASMGISRKWKLFKQYRRDGSGDLQNNQYILTVTDYFTKWVEVFPVPDQTANTCANIILNDATSIAKGRDDQKGPVPRGQGVYQKESTAVPFATRSDLEKMSRLESLYRTRPRTTNLYMPTFGPTPSLEKVVVEEQVEEVIVCQDTAEPDSEPQQESVVMPFALPVRRIIEQEQALEEESGEQQPDEFVFEQQTTTTHPSEEWNMVPTPAAKTTSSSSSSSSSTACSHKILLNKLTI